MATRIDLNADVGESFGTWTLGDDAALLPSLSSINVACGFHAGDPRIIDATLLEAARLGLAVGAHPGYADLRGFGRRPMRADPAEVEADVLYQVCALLGMARSRGLALAHVKPHGALYNQAATDPALATAIARGVARCSRELVLIGLASSTVMREAAAAAGLRYAREAFADRGYAGDGSLLPRGAPGALLLDPRAAAAQAVDIVRDGHVRTPDGSWLRLEADTLCLHGDTPGAPAIATAVRAAFEAAGVRVLPL